MYFSPIRNTLYNKAVRLLVIITYNANFRVLKELEGIYTLNEIISSSNYQYLCEVVSDTKSIK